MSQLKLTFVPTSIQERFDGKCYESNREDRKQTSWKENDITHPDKNTLIVGDNLITYVNKNKRKEDNDEKKYLEIIGFDRGTIFVYAIEAMAYTSISVTTDFWKIYSKYIFSDEDDANTNDGKNDDGTPKDSKIDRYHTLTTDCIWVKRDPEKSKQLIERFDAMIREEYDKQMNKQNENETAVEFDQSAFRQHTKLLINEYQWVINESNRDSKFVNLCKMAGSRSPKPTEISFNGVQSMWYGLPCLFCDGNRRKPQSSKYFNSVYHWSDINFKIKPYQYKILQQHAPTDTDTCEGIYFWHKSPDDKDELSVKTPDDKDELSVKTPDDKDELSVKTPDDKDELSVKSIIQGAFKDLLASKRLPFDVMVDLKFNDDSTLKMEIGQLIGLCKGKILNIHSKIRARTAYKSWKTKIDNYFRKNAQPPIQVKHENIKTCTKTKKNPRRKKEAEDKKDKNDLKEGPKQETPAPSAELEEKYRRHVLEKFLSICDVELGFLYNDFKLVDFCEIYRVMYLEYCNIKKTTKDEESIQDIALQSLWNAIICYLQFGVGTGTKFLTLTTSGQPFTESLETLGLDEDTLNSFLNSQDKYNGKIKRKRT